MTALSPDAFRLVVWDLELLAAQRRARVLIISIAVPLGLVAAVAFGNAPAPHAALVYTVLFTFFGTFGAAIPWARDAERGLIHRLVLAGVPLPWLAAQRIAAGALIDLIELAPSAAVLCVLERATPSQAGLLFGTLAIALLAANTLGVLVAALARSIAETALLAAVSALLLLHYSSVFRTPAAGSFYEAVQQVLPFHYMHRAIGAVLGN